MSPEFIAIIIGFVTLLISILGVVIQLNVRIDKVQTDMSSKFDKLTQKQDDDFKILLSRIDAVNSRLDNLYHELFRKKAA